MEDKQRARCRLSRPRKGLERNDRAPSRIPNANTNGDPTMTRERQIMRRKLTETEEALAAVTSELVDYRTATEVLTARVAAAGNWRGVAAERDALLRIVNHPDTEGRAYVETVEAGSCEGCVHEAEGFCVNPNEGHGKSGELALIEEGRPVEACPYGADAFLVLCGVTVALDPRLRIDEKAPEPDDGHEGGGETPEPDDSGSEKP